MTFFPNIPRHQHTSRCWWDHREARWICTSVVLESVTEGSVAVPGLEGGSDRYGFRRRMRSTSWSDEERG
jgi:hypothetical protein